MDLMKANPKLLTEVLLSQEDLLMNQSDPIFIQCVLKTLGSDLSKVIEFSGNTRTQENIFHLIASELHLLASELQFELVNDQSRRKLKVRSKVKILSLVAHYFESCQYLVDNLEDAFVAKLMLTRSSHSKQSPLILALSSSNFDVANLFWKTCEEAVLNHQSLINLMKVQIHFKKFQSEFKNYIHFRNIF